MKQLLFLIGFILLSGHCCCQNFESSNRGKLSYGIFGGPILTHRFLVSNSNEQWLKDLRDKEEVARVSFSAGFLFEHRMGANFALTFGLNYADRGFQSIKSSPTWTSSNSSYPTETFSSFHYRYFNVPLNVRYYFYKQERFRCFAALGLSLALLYKNNSIHHQRIEGQWRAALEDKVQGFERVNLMGNVELGLQYLVATNIVLAASANFQQSLLATTGLPTKEYLFNSGFLIGVLYSPTKLRQRPR